MINNNILLPLFNALILSIFIYPLKAQQMEANKYPKALVSYEDFKNLVEKVEDHRQERLLSLDDFLKMSQEPNTVILDTRTKERYLAKHISGAIHLNFTEFTVQNLRAIIPDTTTKILIYCNNNFSGDQINFAEKTIWPSDDNQKKPIMLALNIPTYINLYGYGYRNIYELDELVDINDPRIKFEGKRLGK